MVWVKLTRRAETTAELVASGGAGAGEQAAPRSPTAAAIEAQQEHDTKVISLNQKLITPDKRFKVRRQSPLKWILSIDNVGPDDNHAYYLCQSAQQAAQTTTAAASRRLSNKQAAVSSLLNNLQQFAKSVAMLINFD